MMLSSPDQRFAAFLRDRGKYFFEKYLDIGMAIFYIRDYPYASLTRTVTQGMCSITGTSKKEISP